MMNAQHKNYILFHTRYRRYALALLAILILPHCTSKKISHKRVMVTHSRQKINLSQNKNLPPIITVWVHGTFFFSGRSHRKMFRKTPSLKPATSLKPGSYLRAISEALAAGCAQEFPLENSYLFGWSGRLNIKEREYVAHALYRELHNLRTYYQEKTGAMPHIRLIGHSHGASVVLTLAHVQNNTNPTQKLEIEELILLACPVQERTYVCTQDGMFKKIFSLYSKLDLVQICAPQLFHANRSQRSLLTQLKLPPFSGRLFPPQNNLVQAKIRLNGRAIMHSEFVSKRFLSTIAGLRGALHTWLTDQSEQQEPLKHRRLITIQT